MVIIASSIACGGVAQDGGYPPNNRLTETCSLGVTCPFLYQLMPVKSSYLLTSITWPYRGLKCSLSPLFTKPAWSWIARSCSRWSMIFNSVIATKSRTVLLGHPARRNALAMLQWLSESTWRTFWYWLWMLHRLWELMCLNSVSNCCWVACCWWSSSWSSLWLQSDCTSAFRSAMIFFVGRSLLSLFLIASSFCAHQVDQLF